MISRQESEKRKKQRRVALFQHPTDSLDMKRCTIVLTAPFYATRSSASQFVSGLWEAGTPCNPRRQGHVLSRIHVAEPL